MPSITFTVLPIEQHTQAKHEILQNYLKAWFPHVEEIEKLSRKNRQKRKSELYEIIIERARNAQSDGVSKLYSHREIREMVTRSNAQQNRSVLEIAKEFEKNQTSNNDKTRKICPVCKGKGYLLEKGKRDSLTLKNFV